METSEYNDNRPQDGQDEREERRAQQEGYDLETIDRFLALVARFQARDYLFTADLALAGSLRTVMVQAHQFLLEEEGY